jgi:glycosyltransferase involved in cell wall biosynthesis
MDLLQLYHIIQARAQQGLNRLAEYEWVFIEARSEPEVAQILRDSIVFVFLSTTEGLPRMPIEAMRCGDIVLGYCDGPLTELLTPDNSVAANRCNILSVVAHLEQVAETFLENPGHLRPMSEAACRTASEYSGEREEANVMDFWSEMLNGQ